MPNTKLKPCPFCGGEPKLTRAMGEFWIDCLACKAGTRLCTTEDEAVEVWNNRALHNKTIHRTSR